MRNCFAFSCQKPGKYVIDYLLTHGLRITRSGCTDISSYGSSIEVTKTMLHADWNPELQLRILLAVSAGELFHVIVEKKQVKADVSLSSQSRSFPLAKLQI